MLFSGDLFSDYLDSPQLPPRWFNTDLEQCRKSVCLATDLGVNGVVPNHGMIASPAHHRDNLRRLADRILTRWPLASSGR